MTSIAFVVSVSSYDNLNNLSACSADKEVVAELLEATGKFKVFKCASEDSVGIREFLRSAASSYEGQEVSEIFFYFSGHGTIDGDDFIYCCKDYAEDAVRSTSLVGPDVDDIFRSLKPNLMVKFIDACHSGARLIKDSSLFEKALKQVGQFNHFIQFASSMEDQASYADSLMSFFTREFVRGVLQQKTDDVYYRDIKNYLIDAFKSNAKQVPYFVEQSTGREIFSKANEKIKLMAVKPPFGSKAVDDNKSEGSIDLKSLIAQIEGIEKEYPTLDEVNAELEKLKASLSGFNVGGFLGEFYDLSLHAGNDYDDVPGVKSIAKFFDGKLSPDFLVSVEYTEEKVERPDYAFQQFGGGISRWLSSETIPNKLVRVSVPYSISVPVSMPYKYLKIDANPKYKCLLKFSVYFVVVPARNKCYVFAKVIEYTRSDWDQYSPKSDGKNWKYFSLAWRGLTGCVNEFKVFDDFKQRLSDDVTKDTSFKGVCIG